MRSFVIVALLGGVAHAEDKPDAFYPRIALGVHADLWMADIGTVQANGPGVGVDADMRVAPYLFVQARASTAQVEAVKAAGMTADDRSVQLTLRHVMMAFGSPDVGFGGDMFVTSGLSHEWIAFDSGGGLDRTGVVFGVGGSVVIHGRDSSVWNEIEYGFRALVTQAPHVKQPFGCDGPCDTPTGQRPYDATLVMEVGWHVGG